MAHRWSRADGVEVVLIIHSDLTSVVYLHRPTKGTIIRKDFEYWEKFQAIQTAEELVELLGLEEVRQEQAT